MEFQGGVAYKVLLIKKACNKKSLFINRVKTFLSYTSGSNKTSI